MIVIISKVGIVLERMRTKNKMRIVYRVTKMSGIAAVIEEKCKEEKGIVLCQLL